MRRLLNILICLDQLAFSLITLGHASPDETISAGLYRMELQGKWAGRLLRPVVDALFFFDRHHCLKAWQAERSKQQLPGFYR